MTPREQLERTVNYFKLKRLVRKAIREIKNYGKIQNETVKALKKESK